MTVRPIETRYDGCRFRSRLEARWAVFLNRMRIEWQYEPEGLEIDIGRRHMRWLPDFWLSSGQWAEVKGTLDPDEALRLLYLASGVSDCGVGTDVVVLGWIPKQDSLRWPVQLHKHGDLWAVPWTLAPGCPLEQTSLRKKMHGAVEISFLLEGFMCGAPEAAVEALAAARQARFEHGESG
jgi:hypothetical protein